MAFYLEALITIREATFVLLPSSTFFYRSS